MDILETSTFKTNSIFTTTSNETELYKITDFLGRKKGELGEEVFSKSYKWTKDLVTIINPKIIICEGKTAHENLCIFLDIDTKNFSWINDCTKLEINNLIIIGYKRNMFRPNIRNKQELAKLIQESLSELNL